MTEKIFYSPLPSLAYNAKAKINLKNILIITLPITAYILLALHIQWSKFYPGYSDEYAYYLNTLRFYISNSLSAALSCHGGSYFFSADAHGIAYPLLNGLFAKLIGWHNYNFVLLNGLLLMTSLIFLYSQLKNTNQFILASSLILSYPLVMSYTFSFMQESLHMAFAIIVGAQLYTRKNKPQSIASISPVLLMLFIAGLFRVLWFFGSLGLIPLGKDKKTKLILLAISIIFIAISFLYQMYFFEPYLPGYFNSLLQLLKQGPFWEAMKNFFAHFVHNAYLYLTFSEPPKTLYFFLKALFLFNYMILAVLLKREKNAYYLSIFIIYTVTFFLLIALYDAFDFREIKSLAFLYFLILPVLITEKPLKIYAYTLLFANFLLLSSSYLFTKSLIDTRIIDLKAYQAYTQAYSAISRLVTPNATILIKYTPMDLSFDLLALPLVNSKGQKINYLAWSDEKTNFQYEMTRNDGSLPAKPGAKLIFKDPIYKLYQMPAESA